MKTNGLMTLREIADCLEINYNTLISCKKKFEDFLFLKNIGRTQKYPAIYTDFFRLVFALKDEGFVMPQIRSIILNNDRDLLPESLADWVSFWSFEVLNERMNERMNERTNERMNHLTNEPMNDLTIERTNELTNERTNDLTNERTNELMNEPMNNFDDEHSLPSDENETDDFLTPLEKFETQLSEFKDGLIAELLTEIPQIMENQINQTLDDKFQVLTDKLSDHLSGLRAEMNGSLTQFYKAIVSIHEAVNLLNSRLTALESELDAEGNSEIDLYELDLEEVQLKGEEFRLIEEEEIEFDPSKHVDIEYVRKSIFEGKPDKLAVIEWIMAERKKNPPTSYADLANQLNEAGIPTLRGRDNWGRTVVRGLVVKR